MVTGVNSLNILVGTSLPKAEILNIYMRRWRSFSFDPNTDDIEEYICDVHEAVKQLRHGDDAVLNLLKATIANRAVWHLIWA